MRRTSRSERVHRAAGWLVVAMLPVTLLAAACGDSDDEVDPVAAAERRVSAAEDAVTEAEAAFDEATGTFCKDAEAYITSIDRYGHVLDDTAATVGDVNTAGDDLAEPRDAANASAAAVVEGRDQLAQAQQDLANAKNALAEAQSGTSAPRGASTTTTAPLLPAATVDRVEQAETDLAAASEGITDQTPLTEAGAQFNAAAFALEVAWLRVLDDADCLTSDQRSQALTAVAQYTTDLQTALHAAGYYDGPIDGVYGPTTVEAVEALQTDEGLPTTGYADRATAEALDEKVKAAEGESATAAAASTASVQSTLKLAGYWTGPVDGVWTPELTDAVKTFQTDLGVPATGAVDAATLQALEKAITDAKTAATTTTTTTAASTTTEG